MTKRKRFNLLLKWSRWIHFYIAVSLLFWVLFFAVTGITLNHPQWFISDQAEPVEKTFHIPDTLPLSESLQPTQLKALQTWVESTQQVRLSQARHYVEDNEIIFDTNGPGFSSLLVVNMDTRTAHYEQLHYGWLAVLNDLHKGRHTGDVWKILLDIISLLMIVFSISGLILALPNRALSKALSALAIVTGNAVAFYWLFVPW